MKSRIAFFLVSTLIASFASAGPWMAATQTLAADAANQSRPRVAFNSVHDEYLVVWQAEVGGVNQVVGVRVGADGVPVGSSFVISEGSNDQFMPDVAYDPANDHYFVVWMSDYSGDLSDTDIAGRFIPWNGPDPASGSFGINGALSAQWSPSVALSPGIGEFMVVWCTIETAAPATLSVQRWAADGSGSVTPAIAISSGPEYRINPDIVWNDEASEYLVVYERFVGGSEEDVWATRLSWSGSVLGSEIGVAGWPAEESEVAVASCGGDYLVAWKGGKSSSAQVFVRAVASDGTVGATVTNLSGSFFDQNRPVVVCNDGGREYIVAWEVGYESGHRGVSGNFVNFDASAQGTMFDIYVPGAGVLDFTRPGIAIGAGGKSLVAWESDRPDLSSQDIRGRLVSGRVFVGDFEDNNVSRWSAVQN